MSDDNTQKKRRLTILTTEPENFVPVELKAKAESAGWEVTLVNPDECALNVSATPKLLYKGVEVEVADACIPRMSEDDLEYKAAIMDYLADAGVRMLNSSESMKLASNKLQTQILLNKSGVKTPDSSMVASVDQLEAAHKSIGGEFPVVLKTLSGTHGVGVMRVDSAASLMSVAQMLEKMDAQYMLQKYIKHEASRRILMLNGEVLACVSRSVPENDFRTNAHQGAELTLVADPSQKEIDVCKQVCELIGTKLGAVDYLVDGDDIIVFELNGSPGWESMQEVVPDKDIAEIVVAAYGMNNDAAPDEADTKNVKQNGPHPDAVSGELVNISDVDVKAAKEEEKLTPTGSEEDAVEYKNPADDKESKPVDLTPVHTASVNVDGEQVDTLVVGSVQSFIIKRFNNGEPIIARVDTGATGSSLAGDDVEIDGNIIQFTFNKVKYRCHIARTADIKSAMGVTHRPIVKFDIDIGGVMLNNVDFSIDERKDMNYDALLGRNTLAAAGVLINPAMGEVPAQQSQEKTEESAQRTMSESVKFDKFGVSAVEANMFKYSIGHEVAWDSGDGLRSGIVEGVLQSSLIVCSGQNAEYVQKSAITQVTFDAPVSRKI